MASGHFETAAASSRVERRTPAAGKRLSVCYLVPGHNLLTAAGPTRNVLSLARALSAYADVTVVFRRVLEPIAPDGFTVLGIEPAPEAGVPADDAALRGVSFREFLDYLRTLRRWAAEQLTGYDVVLEKTWLLSGYVSARCVRAGIPAIPIENLVQMLDWPWRDRRPIGTYAKHWVARHLAGRFLRRVDFMIAETRSLKAAMAAQWRVSPERIEVVSLGVNRDLFHPRDQAKARAGLGLDPGATVLLYQGILDNTHNLAPLIEAMAQMPDRDLELHLVGDGPRRAFYEERAAALGNRVTFHGYVPHERVPEYIAAADLCLAPYDASAFANKELGYASLKVPEYLSVGRPVVSVPSGRMLEIIRDGVTGFLIDNTVERWARFLRERPSRETLRHMGEEAARSPLDSWDDVARNYYSLCERAVRSMRRSAEGAHGR